MRSLPQGTTVLLFTPQFDPKLLLQAVKKNNKLVCRRMCRRIA